VGGEAKEAALRRPKDVAPVSPPSHNAQDRGYLDTTCDAATHNAMPSAKEGINPCGEIPFCKRVV
jgi:hypothetical protein